MESLIPDGVGENGSLFTVKKYDPERSTDLAVTSEGWRHERILPLAVNSAFEPIEIVSEAAGNLTMVGGLFDRAACGRVASQIHRPRAIESVVVQNQVPSKLLLVGKHDFRCYLISTTVFKEEIYQHLLGKLAVDLLQDPCHSRLHRDQCSRWRNQAMQKGCQRCVRQT